MENDDARVQGGIPWTTAVGGPQGLVPLRLDFGLYREQLFELHDGLCMPETIQAFDGSVEVFCLLVTLYQFQRSGKWSDVQLVVGILKNSDD